MTRRLPWLLLSLALGASCGRNIVPKELNEPCTRTAQCAIGLECNAGVCVPVADAGVDAGA
jgi:hypothetical protein